MALSLDLLVSNLDFLNNLSRQYLYPFKIFYFLQEAMLVRLGSKSRPMVTDWTLWLGASLLWHQSTLLELSSMLQSPARRPISSVFSVDGRRPWNLQTRLL
ncbi:hypothetical protein NMG60_11019456 [Bertholletia excelsa]